MNRSPRSFLFAAALTAIAVISGAWLYTGLMPMRFLESGYPIWVAKQAILHECTFGSVLVLGDSRPEAAIVPADLQLPAANISFGGTTPIETYFFARTAVACPNPPRLVIYAHSMPSYTGPNQVLWKSAARYGSLRFRDLREIAGVAGGIHDPTLADVSTHDGMTGIVRDAAYGIGFPSVFMASLVEARGNGRYDSNKVLFERTAATRGQVTYIQPAEKRLVGIDADVTTFVPSRLETVYFEKTLALFAAAHVRVIVLTIPASESTVRAIPPILKREFARYLTGHTDRYPNVVAAASELVAWPDDFYIDGSHMNERGARFFSARLATCLRQWDDASNRATPCDLVWK